MLRFDVRNFSDTQREELAARVRVSKDFDLPRLSAWNYELCRKHRNGWVEEFTHNGQDMERVVRDRPMPGCRKCGIHFRQHQRVGIMWLYLKKRGLLADPMGTGKTTHAGGLIAMLKETGEIPAKGRVIVCPRAPALMQWHDELLRMMPGLNVILGVGRKDRRVDLYRSPWETLLISPQTLINDYESLLQLPLAALITDDVDALRNRDTATSNALKKVGRHADRMVVMTGTPLQKKLEELHSTLDPLGGLQIFGDQETFLKRHTRLETITEYDPRTHRQVARKTITGYRNLALVKEQMAPLVLRRRIEDLEDVNMPTIVPNDVMLDLYPAQRAKYTELQRGVLTIMKETGTTTKHTTAMSKLIYGAQICGGLSTLGEPDGPRTSVKMDWIEEKLTGELEDEKVVIFAQFKNSVRSLHQRLRERGIGFETVWGEAPDKMARARSQERFWEDPNCRVLIGTQAIEQSLNLQIARHLINMDMILNPARMKQLAGRIRRDGSAFQHVFVHNLLTVGTQEERYLPLLEREAALSDYVWDESAELFQALSPMMMLQLIAA